MTTKASLQDSPFVREKLQKLSEKIATKRNVCRGFATALTRYLDALKTPYVLLGDFNDEPASRTLALFKSRAVEARKPDGDHFTFSSTEPTKEIDFIFTAPAAAWRAHEVRVISEPLASDHRPVLAVLELLVR